MIPRYDKEEISSIWNDHSKYQAYLDVELAILKALEGDKVPEGISDTIRKKAVINPQRVDEIEAKTKHDVIAFCTSITENLTAEEGKYFHFGVTSSDIIDSAWTLLIKRSLEQILPVYKSLLQALYARAEEMKPVLTLGRSHGMFAEPMSFGGKLLGHYCEFSRRYQELKDFYENELTIQFSGAVGNYAVLTPELEEKAAGYLGLKVEPTSTQVIPRDRMAKLISINGLLASAIERIAVEIRHLHRSDVAELHEGFSKGQKGSSTMPHKKNPISGENLTGMARVIRSHTMIALENIVLWHERDISHSSAERLYFPDNMGLVFYSLGRLKSTVENLVFHQEEIEGKVKRNFTYLSSYYLHQLISQSNFQREELYEVVQAAAFEAHQDGKAETFHSGILTRMSEKGVEINLPKPSFEEIQKIYNTYSDKIFKRSMTAYPLPN